MTEIRRHDQPCETDWVCIVPNRTFGHDLQPGSLRETERQNRPPYEARSVHSMYKTRKKHRTAAQLGSMFLMCFLCLSIVSAQESGVSPEASQLILHLRDEFPSIRKTIQKLDEAPEAGRFTIWDKNKYQEDLNEYLDDALSLLLPEIYRTTKEGLQDIDKKVGELRKEKSDMQTARALEARSPRAKPGIVRRMLSWLPKDEYTEKVQALEDEITQLNGRRNQLIHDFRSAAKKQFGIEFEENQIEVLLYQVNGADLVDAVAVANILTDVEAHIRNIIVDPEDAVAPEVRLQYYGFALIVRLVIERLHARHLENYDAIYLPALSELEQENQRTMDENLQTLTSVKEDKQRRTTIEANIRVLGMAKKAVTDYREILIKRRDTTKHLLQEAHKDALVARSTLMTLEMVMNVEHVASKALAEFAALSRLDAPDLLPLDDQEMYHQYLDISRLLSNKR